MMRSLFAEVSKSPQPKEKIGKGSDKSLIISPLSDKQVRWLVKMLSTRGGSVGGQAGGLRD